MAGYQLHKRTMLSVIEQRLGAEPLAVLLNPCQWRLVYPGPDGELHPAEPHLLQWMNSHCNSHSFLEVLVVLAGDAYYGVNGRILTAKPGAVVAFLPNLTHQSSYPKFYPEAIHLWLVVTRFHYTACLFSIDNSGVKRLISSPFMPIPPFPGMPTQAAPLAMEKLHVMALTTSLVLAFLGSNEKIGDKTEIERDTLHREMISIVKQHISHTAGCNVTLDSLAQMSGYSKYHFSRLFKQFTGQTTWEFIDQIRVQKARQMIAEGRLLKEVSAELGFSCPASFSNWARKRQLHDKLAEPERPQAPTSPP